MAKKLVQLIITNLFKVNLFKADLFQAKFIKLPKTELVKLIKHLTKDLTIDLIKNGTTAKSPPI